MKAQNQATTNILAKIPTNNGRNTVVEKIKPQTKKTLSVTTFSLFTYFPFISGLILYFDILVGDSSKKGKSMVLDIAPLTGAQQHFTILEVAADWHWL